MKKHTLQLLFFLGFIVTNFQSKATGVAGGTIEFTHKTGNTYTIKLIIDIDEAQSPASPALYVGNTIKASIFAKGTTAATDAKVKDYPLNFVSNTPLDYTDKQCAAGVAVKTARIVFSADVILVTSTEPYNSPNGYYITWEDGPRNATINASNQGMSWYLEFPALNSTPNSSPVFKATKSIVACTGKTFSIDLSATDADATDTRTYAFGNAYTAQNKITYGDKAGLGNLAIGSSFARRGAGGFVSPYPATSPMGAGVTLSAAGILSGIAPTVVGKYLVVVECKEFRGTTQIGLNRLEIEIVVDICTPQKPIVYLEGDNPPVHVNSAFICDESYRVLETIGNTAFTYQWQKNGVNIPGATKYQLKVTYAEATATATADYTVIVTQPAGGSCGGGTSTSLKTSLFPQGGAALNLTASQTVFCESGTSVLTFTQNGSINDYIRRWYKDNVLIPNTFGGTYSATDKGTYKVVLTQIASPKCIFEDSVKVTITPLPKPTIKNATPSGKTSVCFGDVITLQIDPVEKDVKYTWIKGGANDANTTAITVSALGTYTYGIYAESTVNPGCFNFAPTPITVNINPYPVVTFASIPPLCSNSIAKIDLRNYVTPTYTPTEGKFSGTGIVNSYEFDPKSLGFGSFPIKYTYTTTEGCTKDNTQTILIDQTPVIRLGDDITIFRGESVQIKSVGSSGSKYKYEWTPPTGLDSPTIPQPIAKPDATTEYEVKVTAILSGCFNKDKIKVFVRATLEIPLAFTPNSDSVNDEWVIMDNNRQANDYPDIEVKIYNRWGSEIFSSVGSGQYNTRRFDGIKDGERLPAGTYFYVIKPSPDVPALTGYVTIIR
jgi:gliding motility-associated-like protein